MPIQKGSATFSRYRVAPAGKRPAARAKDLAAALRTHAFQPLAPDAQEERSAGFVEYAAGDATEFAPGAVHHGDIALFAYRIDEVRIPGPAIRAELESWSKRFQLENDRPPGTKEKADAKEEIKHTLRSRYPLASRRHEVSWNQTTDLLQVWAGSRKAVDEVQAELEKTFSLKLLPVVPVAVAARLELAVDALKPTPALSAPEVAAKKEAAHGRT